MCLCCPKRERERGRNFKIDFWVRTTIADGEQKKKMEKDKEKHDHFLKIGFIIGLSVIKSNKKKKRKNKPRNCHAQFHKKKLK